MSDKQAATGGSRVEKNMVEELLNIIKSRRSVRSFDSQRAVAEESIEILLEGARWAPSAGNVQPWVFYVVKGKEVKVQLVRAALGQAFIAEAPVVIVVCVDEREAFSSYGARGRDLYCLQDTAAAIQNMLLLAKAQGLGSCWIGAFEENRVSRAINCGQFERPVAIIPIGYPGEKPGAPPRKPVARITRQAD